MPPKRGKPSPFSSDQDAYIESFFPQLMLQTTANLKTWKKDQSEAISESPLFLAKLPTKEQDSDKGADLAEWKTRIERKFQNFYNRHQSGSLYFSPLSGVALFEKEHRKSIASSALALAAETKTGKDACYRTCWQQKWDALDHDSRSNFEARASNTPSSVATNQADFPRTAGHFLNELCQGGQVGNLEVMLFWAFHEDDGELRHGIINAHSSNDVPNMASTTTHWDANFAEPWKDFAAHYIPKIDSFTTTKVQRNVEGLPIFPDMDLTKSTASSICDVMVEYLSQLWQISWKDTPLAWDRIVTEPAIYYDDKIFSLPVPLQAPQLLGPGKIFELAEYFATVKPPFTFRPQVEADRLRQHLVPGDQDTRQSPRTVDSPSRVIPPAPIISEDEEPNHSLWDNDDPERLHPDHKPDPLSKKQVKGKKRREGDLASVQPPKRKDIKDVPSNAPLKRRRVAAPAPTDRGSRSKAGPPPPAEPMISGRMIGHCFYPTGHTLPAGMSWRDDYEEVFEPQSRILVPARITASAE
ncbi:hypothetical protein K438DRAFT_1997410 [Mycena galopus ATCC 62051]|nr:hypothetical protein K438DRAFT_1997410 [Mycena galopus ATCC 62051]